MKTDTVDQHWNDQWAGIEQGSKWLIPENDITTWAKTLPSGARILDLGAGVGRHALWLANEGFAATALDSAPDGLADIDRAGDIKTVEARMDALPFDDQAFDHVLSWNVIYHGDETVLLRTINEIRRVLKPGGPYLGTLLSKRRLPHERSSHPGHEISRNTWVFDAPGTDKVHPHFFCSAAELIALFSGFKVLALKDLEHENPESFHWHMIMERL